MKSSVTVNHFEQGALQSFFFGVKKSVTAGGSSSFLSIQCSTFISVISALELLPDFLGRFPTGWQINDFFSNNIDQA